MTKTRFTVEIKQSGGIDKDFLKSIQKKAVKIGFLDGKSTNYPNGESVVKVAMQNEFGFINEDGAKVPARPFFKLAWNKNESKYKRVLSSFVNNVVIKRAVTSDEFFGRLGVKVQKDIRKEIRDLREPPNAPYTIAKKGSDNPLIDTKHMLNSVAWELVDG